MNRRISRWLLALVASLACTLAASGSASAQEQPVGAAH